MSMETALTTWYFNLLGIPIGRGLATIRTFGPTLIILVIFFLLIYFVPGTKVRFNAALLGSVSGVLIITVFNKFSNLLTRMATNFSVIYGSFASVFLFLFFCYVFWATVFFSVELAYVFQFKPEGGGYAGLPQSPAQQLSEGTNIMMLIGSNFREGKGPRPPRRWWIVLLSHSTVFKATYSYCPTSSSSPRPTIVIPPIFQPTLESLRIQDLSPPSMVSMPSMR